jgi:hypothetical protein
MLQFYFLEPGYDNLLSLVAMLPLVGVTWRGYAATCTGTESSDWHCPIPFLCIGRCGLILPFQGCEAPKSVDPFWC